MLSFEETSYTRDNLHWSVATKISQRSTEEMAGCRLLETTITSLNTPNYKFTMPLSSLYYYYIALRHGLSPRPSLPLTSMTESCNPRITNLALWSCVKWGALPEYWSAEHSPHHWSVFSGSVCPMMTTLPELFTSSTCHLQMASWQTTSLLEGYCPPRPPAD